MKILTEKNLTNIFNVLCCIFYIFLSLISFQHSCANSDNLEDEHVYMYNDSRRVNTVWIMVILLLLLLVYYMGRRYADRIYCNHIAAVVILMMTAFSIYWVSASNTAPQSDQLSICNAASAFNRGDYAALKRGGYAAIYPQQLGLITFMRGIFALCGADNYRAYQYFSACMIPVYATAGYWLVNKISSRSKSAALLYLGIVVTCIPMYIYVPFVYGEIPSTALVMLTACILISCLERFHWGKVIGVALCAGMAVQLRQNTIIFVIGMLIAIAVKLFSGIKWQYLCTAAGILIGVLVLQKAVDGIYAPYIAEEDRTAIPSILWVAMGTNDDMEFAGWYNTYLDLYEETGYDDEVSKQKAMEDIGAFVEKCRQKPQYALDFYKRKINYQWNSPMYQSLAINNYVIGEQSELAREVYYGDLRESCESFMNMHHFWVYFGCLLFTVFCFVRRTGLQNYALLIGVFGGFLFTIIWETKTRYGFPYYIVMLHFAAVGISFLLRQIISIWDTHKKIA